MKKTKIPRKKVRGKKATVTQKSVIINKAICRFKHEEKEDEFHAKRMESIQPLKWQE